MTSDRILRQESAVPQEFKHSDAYRLPPGARSYGNQFNKIYGQRVKKLKSRCLKMANAKWKQETINDTRVVYVNKILDVKSMTPSYTIGTVFMDMKYKPNILEDVSNNVYGAEDVKSSADLSKLDQIRAQAYSDPQNDQVMLEDESGRMILAGEILDNILLVTGVVVGVLGMEVDPGIFTVVDVVYPEAGAQIPRSVQNTGNKLLFISGLHINPESNLALVEILKEYLMGELDTAPETIEFLKSITEVVLAGDSIKCSDKSDQVVLEKDKYRELNKSNYDADALKQLDRFVSELLNSVPVTIMPGDSDPSESSLPKQPLHPSFFSSAGQFTNFKRATNPTWFEIDGLRLLGTSGENINDIFKYFIPNLEVDLSESSAGTDSPVKSEIINESRIKLLEATLHWQNIVPTAPDTLTCYPYETEDPFSLDETPHVYFVGNQPKFETSELTLFSAKNSPATVRIVCVPDFSETGQVAVLDMDSLECTALQIAAT
ncbi:hypothetical protein OGAPHI_006048 [Ogataea philodendri]|uniref:DNA-directed DNA polymerase n=1 Tax=Ogataea philodendri TaxID=1378263 RepID=A0A9P8NYM2_9ASCO|nr:uncharacterized protein OGAPHI_006048 [Ogataea philodendri]KAH3661869.1 hypothetical protein OGAPHI_006048 [Ogataea philodendri]